MYVKNKILNKLLHYSWDLAYGIYSEDTISLPYKKLEIRHIKNPYPSKWFADPFILKSSNNELHLLVEEFDYSVNRGRIARLIIDKNNNIITNCKIILDLPTHLSFPAIYKINGKIYVHPENYQSGSSIIYEYDEINEKLVNPNILINEPLTDAVIVLYDNVYRIYSTKAPNANGNELCIYESEHFFGPYIKQNSIFFDNNCARMAGMFIRKGDKLIRPAQDCNGAYGKAIFFMDKDQCYNKLCPTGIKYAGIHTFNLYENEFIIDLKKYDFPLVYFIKEKIKNIFR